MSGLTPEAAYNANIVTLSGLQKTAEERYDAILTTLGSAFLALSVSFVKDVVPLAEARLVGVLFTSWAAFALTIIATVASLSMSTSAVRWHKDKLSPNEYPVADLDKLNPWSRTIRWMNLLAGVAFGAGVMCTVAFAVSNTIAWRSNVEKRVSQSGEVQQKGFTMPPMQTGTPRPAPANDGGGVVPVAPANSPPPAGSSDAK